MSVRSAEVPALREKISKELKVIEREVLQLCLDERLFWGSVDCLKGNPAAHSGNMVYGALGAWYVTSQCMAIRRMSDCGSEAISLR